MPMPMPMCVYTGAFGKAAAAVAHERGEDPRAVAAAVPAGPNYSPVEITQMLDQAAAHAQAVVGAESSCNVAGGEEGLRGGSWLGSVCRQQTPRQQWTVVVHAPFNSSTCHLHRRTFRVLQSADTSLATHRLPIAATPCRRTLSPRTWFALLQEMAEEGFIDRQRGVANRLQVRRGLVGPARWLMNTWGRQAGQGCAACGSNLHAFQPAVHSPATWPQERFL